MKTRRSTRVMRRAGGMFALGITLGAAVVVWAQAPQKTPDLTGTYRAVSANATLPGGLKNAGTPEAISVQPAAATAAASRDLSLDPAKHCQVIGPFRYLARETVLMDVLPAPVQRSIHVVFEEVNLGNHRQILLDRAHNPRKPASRRGEAVGKWEGDTLVVETTNFNQDVWLNSKGIIPSRALRLTERYRLVANGRYLEAKVTATDPEVLTAPYTYTRYFERTDAEIPQTECWSDLVPSEIPTQSHLTR